MLHLRPSKAIYILYIYIKKIIYIYIYKVTHFNHSKGSILSASWRWRIIKKHLGKPSSFHSTSKPFLCCLIAQNQVLLQHHNAPSASPWLQGLGYFCVFQKQRALSLLPSQPFAHFADFGSDTILFMRHDQTPSSPDRLGSLEGRPHGTLCFPVLGLTSCLITS